MEEELEVDKFFDHIRLQQQLDPASDNAGAGAVPDLRDPASDSAGAGCDITRDPASEGAGAGLTSDSALRDPASDSAVQGLTFDSPLRDPASDSEVQGLTSHVCELIFDWDRLDAAEKAQKDGMCKRGGVKRLYIRWQ
jgi:hypothetical protein